MDEPDETARNGIEAWKDIDPDFNKRLRGTLTLAEAFQLLINELKGIDAAYLNDDNYPITGENVRNFAIGALDAFRRYLPGKMLPAALEVLVVELSEINAGRKSSLLQPSASETNKVRLTVRAASAATLHVLVQQDLASVEEGAAVISKELFKASIHRTNSDGEESQIPPATVIDWRKHRQANSPAFKYLFAHFTNQINIRISDNGNDASLKKEVIIGTLNQLVRIFNYK
jgi:hypothetical protein